MICSKCDTDKPLDEFPSNGRGGKAKRCKECNRAHARAYYRKNPEPYKQRARENESKRNRDDKLAIYKQVEYAVRTGTLVKPDVCSRCDETESIEGHHEDYSKPLEVIWLCKACHMKAHRING